MSSRLFQFPFGFGLFHFIILFYFDLKNLISQNIVLGDQMLHIGVVFFRMIPTQHGKVLKLKLLFS